MARWPKEIPKAKRKTIAMPFDASPQQPAFLSEKARRLLDAHDREVGRNHGEKPLKVDVAGPNHTS